MTKSIRLLDCTLRDGGYINDWGFGEAGIRRIIQDLTAGGLDIVEVGFLRDEESNPERAVFSSVESIHSFTGGGSCGKTAYCVMCEALDPLPARRISRNDFQSVEIIRVIVWQRLLEENFAYCRQLVEKGYRLCVQPNRIDSYSGEEFAALIRRFNVLRPMALYVVDSFGLLTSSQLLEYVRIADRELWEGGAIGYHGHNNMQQAFETAQRILTLDLERDVILDGSVYGIGRGAGNLASELIAEHLNRYYNTEYDIEKLLKINDEYVQRIYEEEPWGYLPCYYLTAKNRCNPMYGKYYGLELKLSAVQMNRILELLSPEDRVRFSKDKAMRYAEQAGIL